MSTDREILVGLLEEVLSRLKGEWLSLEEAD